MNAGDDNTVMAGIVFLLVLVVFCVALTWAVIRFRRGTPFGRLAQQRGWQHEGGAMFNASVDGQYSWRGGLVEDSESGAATMSFHAGIVGIAGVAIDVLPRAELLRDGPPDARLTEWALPPASDAAFAAEFVVLTNSPAHAARTLSHETQKLWMHWPGLPPEAIRVGVAESALDVQIGDKRFTTAPDMERFLMFGETMARALASG
jgi:hypothetical protein